MYLEKLELINTGPIDHVVIEPEFNADGTPKPLVLVGQNGAGKSIAISHIVSALISAHSQVYDDADVEKGRVYKLRSPIYIKAGCDYAIGKLEFSGAFEVAEIQLGRQKQDYSDSIDDYPKWNDMGVADTSHYYSNFSAEGFIGTPPPQERLVEQLSNETHIYFPPNRFEEPAWLNEHNLKNQVSYASLVNFSSHSNRPVIQYTPLNDLQSWLLDLIYDAKAHEQQVLLPSDSQLPNLPLGFQAGVFRLNVAAKNILTLIENLLQELLKIEGDMQWSVGRRSRRRITILGNDGRLIATNLFSLSTGEALLLDLFLTIIRDFDLSRSPLTSLQDIKGMVVVDEIDLHLHIDFQRNLLPKLLKLFPNVQFIITTHSPLFLIGMREEYTEDGFQLVELPHGEQIEVERFSEFDAAYSSLKESARFGNEVQILVEKAQKAQIFMEGTTDIDYLRKAAEHLDKQDILDRFSLEDGDGCGNLAGLWKQYNKGSINASLRQKMVLLFDCDTQKEDKENGRLFQRVIPEQAENKIKVGIENLFSNETIESAIAHRSEFVDKTDEHTKTERGERITFPEKWEVNKDEKRNLCDWFCENGTAEDFARFSIVFDILEAIDTSSMES